MPFDAGAHRRKPDPYFYLFSLDAHTLRALTGIQRRLADEPRPGVDELGVQRRHDPARSEEIARYVRYGYPWSELTERQRKTSEYRDLRKPGWLPTAVIVNILGTSDKRAGNKVRPDEVVRIEDADDGAWILLPDGVEDPAWRPAELPPLEVIDGQHRIWAFAESRPAGTFELPVVAFPSLDISWQAYLFYTINIKPKRINRSLAFDLYPLLRTEDWLERFEGPAIYRETRAQELTEVMWTHPLSPWRGRINMLGEPGRSGVTQAAWIRGLMASLIKRWEGPGIRIGGLFGGTVGKDDVTLPWDRAQQAAFLLHFWRGFSDASPGENEAPWVEQLGAASVKQAMFSGFSLINTDQGLRAALHVLNDLTYLRADPLKLSRWTVNLPTTQAIDEHHVTQALASLAGTSSAAFLDAMASRLATFDWRTAAAPGLSEEEHLMRLALRGSGGYRELRRLVLRHLAGGRDAVAAAASEALKRLSLA